MYLNLLFKYYLLFKSSSKMQKQKSNIFSSQNHIYLEGEIYDCIETFKYHFIKANSFHSKNIVLHIDSPGGSVPEAEQIVDMIVTNDKCVDCIIHDRAYSAAAVIASHCSFIQMTKYGKILIHFSRNSTTGQIKENIEDVLFWCQKLDQPVEIISDLMKNERIISSDQALELGFVSNILNI